MNRRQKNFFLSVGFWILVFGLIFFGLKYAGFFSVTQRAGCTPPETISYELTGDYLAGVCASEPPKEASGFAFYRYYANYFAFDESAPYEQGKNPFSITQEVYNSGSIAAESWTCGEWGACSNSLQSRTCTDAGNTGRSLHKPVVSQGCVSVSEPVQAAPVVSQPAVSTSTTTGNVVGWVVGSVFILLFLYTAYRKWNK